MELLEYQSIKRFYINRLLYPESQNSSMDMSDRQIQFIKGMSLELTEIYKPLYEIKNTLKTVGYFRKMYKNSGIKFSFKLPVKSSSK